MVFDLKRKEKKFYFTEEIPALEEEEYIETDTSKSEYITKWINDNTVDEIEYNSIDDLEDIYHAYIFNQVILEKKSIMQLARETTITYHSLRNTVQIIKNEIKRNYETWYNTRKDI